MFNLKLIRLLYRCKHFFLLCKFNECFSFQFLRKRHWFLRYNRKISFSYQLDFISLWLCIFLYSVLISPTSAERFGNYCRWRNWNWHSKYNVTIQIIQHLIIKRHKRSWPKILNNWKGEAVGHLCLVLYCWLKILK